jgi:hypothetical protein
LGRVGIRDFDSELSLRIAGGNREGGFQESLEGTVREDFDEPNPVNSIDLRMSTSIV